MGSTSENSAIEGEQVVMSKNEASQEWRGEVAERAREKGSLLVGCRLPSTRTVNPQHGLRSNKMALITSDCGKMRSLSIKWP